MRTRTFPGWTPVAVAALLALLATNLQGNQDNPVPKFVGADECGRCHNSKATGQQLQVWRAGPHGGAYKILGTDAAKQVAAKFGIMDPQNSMKCLRCHTTACGESKTRFGDHFKPTDGVQCESCHGAGEHYAKIDQMIDSGKATTAGLVDPGPSVCQRCHNAEGPTFKGFDYKTAVQKIRHHLAAY